MAQQDKTLDGTGIATPGELRIADLPHGHGLTDRYDQILFRLCDTATRNLSASITDSATRFCHHLRHAFNADTIYLCNRNSLSVVATSSADNANTLCDDTQEIHSALTAMVSDLWNCKATLCPPALKVFPEEQSFTYCIVPLNDQHNHSHNQHDDQLLIIVNADVDSSMIGDYMADALAATCDVFLQHEDQAPLRATCESTVFDVLHKKYRISSTAVANRRHEIFQNDLTEIAVEFEGLSQVNKKNKLPALYTRLPDQLYAIAALWDGRFQTTLDCYCLVESAHGYKALCDNENLLKFSDGRSLKVKVHASTLTDLSYIETLRDLTEKAIVHSSTLMFVVVSSADEDYTEALQSLCSRFNIPCKNTRPVASPATIAAEFDLLHINGLRHSKEKQG